MTINRIQLFGPINSTGYGIHFTKFASVLVNAAASRNIRCSIFPISQVDNSQITQELANALRESDSFDPGQPSIKLWHDIDMATFCGKPRIGYTVFELSNLSLRGWNHMKSVDHCWVVSEWAKDILSQQIDSNKIKVIPEGVDYKYFSYQPISHNNTD